MTDQSNKRFSIETSLEDGKSYLVITDNKYGSVYRYVYEPSSKVKKEDVPSTHLYGHKAIEVVVDIIREGRRALERLAAR